MKKLKKILSFFMLIAILFSSFNIVKAEGEEVSTENTDEINNEEVVNTRSKTCTEFELVVGNKCVNSSIPGTREEKRKNKIKLTNYDRYNRPFKHKLTSNGDKLYHKPAWMHGIGLAEKCQKGTMYFVLDETGKKIDKYEIKCAVEFENGEIKKDFSKDVFKGMDTGTGELDNSESINNDESEEAKTEVDDFIKDLLGFKSSNILKKVNLETEKIVLGGNKLATSIKAYSLNKEKLEIKKFELNGLKNKDYYNGIVARLFTDFEKNTKLNSSKIDFSKKISNVSFSFSSYMNDNLENGVREIFRKKFVNDLKELQISYSKIKRQDSKVTNFLLNRG